MREGLGPRRTGQPAVGPACGMWHVPSPLLPGDAGLTKDSRGKGTCMGWLGLLVQWPVSAKKHGDRGMGHPLVERE